MFNLKFVLIFVSTNKQKQIIMNTPDFTNTGNKIKYENGKTFSIYSKMTKKGVRFYTFSSNRMFPISQERINDLICL